MSEQIVNLNIKIRESLKDEFSVAVKLEGFDMSGLLRNFMIRTVREVKAKDPQAFEAALEIERAKSLNEENPDNLLKVKKTKIAALDTSANKENEGSRKKRA